MTGETRPLIVTARFDPETFSILDRLRRTHFPPARNVLSAHLTLFHALPGERLTDAIRALTAAAATQSDFAVTFKGFRSLGRGVALDVHAPALIDVRRHIASDFAGALTAQDQNGFRPHVTIQNKVSPEAARRLLAALAAGFTPWTGCATGLLLWRYLDGPWKLEAKMPFADGLQKPQVCEPA